MRSPASHVPDSLLPLHARPSAAFVSFFAPSHATAQPQTARNTQRSQPHDATPQTATHIPPQDNPNDCGLSTNTARCPRSPALTCLLFHRSWSDPDQQELNFHIKIQLLRSRKPNQAQEAAAQPTMVKLKQVPQDHEVAIHVQRGGLVASSQTDYATQRCAETCSLWKTRSSAGGAGRRARARTERRGARGTGRCAQVCRGRSGLLFLVSSLKRTKHIFCSSQKRSFSNIFGFGLFGLCAFVRWQ